MAKRSVLFSESLGKGPDGVLRPRSVIRCGRCQGKGTASVYAAEAPARFRLKGWVVGEEPYAHRCPACNSAAARAAAIPMIGGMARMPEAITPPRPASPEDKRRIREALDARYDEEKGAYREAWSDKALGATLDVPAAWVRDLREAMGLGPDRNESHEVFARELALARQDLDAASASHAEAAKRLGEAEGRLKRLELGASYQPKGATA